MKKKAELSRNSYLLKSLKSMSVYKLMANTFNGFVYIEFDQTLDILQSKKLLLFIQIPTELHCCLQIFILFWTEYTCEHFAYRLAHYPKKELVINNYLLFWVSALNDVRLSDSQICKLSEKKKCCWNGELVNFLVWNHDSNFLKPSVAIERILKSNMPKCSQDIRL